MKKKISLIFFLICLLFSITGCSDRGTGLAVIPSEKSISSEPFEVSIPEGSMVTTSDLPQENFYEIGETFNYLDWKFKVDAIEIGTDPAPFTRDDILFFDLNNQTKKWKALPEGYQYVKLDLSVTNHTGIEQEFLYGSIRLYTPDFKRFLELQSLSDPEHKLTGKRAFFCTFQPEETVTRKLLFVINRQEYKYEKLLLCPNILGKDIIMDRDYAKKVPFVTIPLEGE